jgi:hypothetical protein
MDEQTIYEELVNQGYTEEQIQQIMELALLNPEREGVKREQGYVDALRQTPAPEGRSVGSGGRLFVASTPLENAGALFSRGVGLKNQGGLDQKSRDIEEQAVKSRIEWLRRGGVGSPSPYGTPPISPGTPAQTYGLGPNF